jgi:2-haloacid dehalogenase
MSQPLNSTDHPVSPDGPRRPALLLFDVNETLSDMSPMAGRFEDVGAPGHLAKTWFAGLLRDGFALTAAGVAEPFARVGAEALRTTLRGLPLTKDLDEAVAHIMDGFAKLRVHADVPEGVRALHDLGIRLVTLSNGSSAVARRLLEEEGLLEYFEQLLSVEDAGIWKPAAGAYGYALDRCGVEPMDAMLVAVHPWDTDGARRADVGSVWVNRGGGSYPGYFMPPDLEVATLSDLAERLR